MNISIDIRCLMEKNLTGVGEYTLNLLKHLLKIDSRNQYFLFFNTKKDVKPIIQKHLGEVLLQKNVHLAEFNFPNKLLNLSLKLFKYPQFDKLINKKYKTKIDKFFFPNISFLSTSCPYLITCHDLSFKIFPYFFSWKRKLWHKIINPKKLYQNAEKIISVSNNTTKDLNSKFKIQDSKIQTIYSGINLQLRNLEKDNSTLIKFKQEKNIPENFIFFLATFEPRKNIINLIKAFEKFKQKDTKNYSLILAGGLGWKHKKIIKQLNKSNFKTHTITTDFLKTQEKNYYYNLAKLFIFPSFYEGFGFPPLEAMQCGCPVLTAANSSLTEVCENSAFYINSHNINNISETLNLILKNQELLEKYSLKGLEQVKKFSWEKCALETLKLFK